MEQYQVAVVGLGALGSAAAYQLARRGVSVIGFEQYPLGHVRGASHDTSRILRRTYHAPEYVRLAATAYRDWRELESATGEQLVTTTGGLVFCPPGAPFGLDDFVSSLEECDERFSVLDPHDVTARWPVLRPPAAVPAVMQADSGIVGAARTTAVLQILARVAGAVLRAECAVTALEPTGAGVVLRTASGPVRADRVLLCADAWTNKLLAPLGAQLPLSCSLEQVSYFEPEHPDRFAVGRLPVWIWEDEPCYYGFPSYGEQTIKAARDCSGIELDVDHRSFAPDDALLAELAEFLDGLLPGKGRHLRTVTCQYTLTPDRDFVLGPLAEHPQLIVALGAGHAFKFVPTIGRILCDLATTGTTDADLRRFAADRPALAGASTS